MTAYLYALSALLGISFNSIILSLIISNYLYLKLMNAHGGYSLRLNYIFLKNIFICCVSNSNTIEGKDN